MAIDERLLDIVVCPACHGELRPCRVETGEGLQCFECGRVYPVREGIPVLLIDEATPPTREEADR
jgi:uncharacterized protein YbaR (Trm112 family)